MVAAARLFCLETGFVGEHCTAAIHRICVNGPQLYIFEVQ